MLKYLVGIRRGFSKAYNVVSNIFRRHGRLKYSVNGVDCNYRPVIMPVTWLSFIASLQVTSVKDLGYTKKNLSVREATENLITEADDLFSENKYKELYELLYPYKESNDIEILWRLSRALHHMSKQQCHNEEKKRYVFEGYDLIVKALQLNDSHYAVHKWYAIFLDTRAAYDGIKARVTQLPNVKNHLLQAVELNPKDATTLYILGYWMNTIKICPETSACRSMGTFHLISAADALCGSHAFQHQFQLFTAERENGAS